MIAISLSDRSAAAAGIVTIWPIDFTTMAYEYTLEKKEFFDSFIVTTKLIALGGTTNILLVILAAYALSKENKSFRLRTVYVWTFVFTILFNGGLIPFYMTIKYTGLLNNLWALVIPVAIPQIVFNLVLLLNFFRNLPRELEESAFIDGAGQWITLWRIYLPLSLPALATITLFTLVFHWNSWFYGLILMNRPENYPLSSYLQTVISKDVLLTFLKTDPRLLSTVSDQTAKAAQIVLATLPILVVYPFLQKYFVKGIVLGSVKE
jgi:putative aldouronate transport system permease protein